MAKRRPVQGTLLLICAFVLFGISMYLSLNSWRLLREGLRAGGIVVGIHESDDTYAPVFVFHDRSGTEYRVTETFASSSMSYKAGDTVEVLYRPQWPQYACINSFKFLWGGPLLGLSVSGVFGLAGIHCLRGGSRLGSFLGW